jgi:hypothetical protein
MKRTKLMRPFCTWYLILKVVNDLLYVSSPSAEAAGAASHAAGFFLIAGASAGHAPGLQSEFQNLCLCVLLKQSYEMVDCMV